MSFCLLFNCFDLFLTCSSIAFTWFYYTFRKLNEKIYLLLLSYTAVEAAFIHLWDALIYLSHMIVMQIFCCHPINVIWQFFSSDLSLTITITLYTSSSRFFQIPKVLFDGRVVSMSENKYGFAVNFLHKFLYTPKSTSDEWLGEICWSSRLLGIFIIKNCVVFSHTFFGSWNWDCKMNTKEIFCFRLLIKYYCNYYWMKFLIADYISNHTVENYQNFSLFSWIVVFNTAEDIIHIIWVFYKNLGVLEVFYTNIFTLFEIVIFWFV